MFSKIQDFDLTKVVISAVVGRTDFGSFCDVCFESSSALADARAKVRAMRHHFGNDVEKKVWLDIKNTPAQNRDLRIVYRLAEAFLDLEANRPDSANVVKKTGKREVQVQDRHAFWVAEGRAMPSAWCKSRYNADDLALIVAYAEA